MTQKEIDEFLADTKVYVAGKSGKIQEKLFSLGYKWCDGLTIVNNTENPFLFIYKNKSFIRGSNMFIFSNHENREISAEEILSLELTKSKFDPKTLQPFDKVLVRDNEEGRWVCSLYSHYREYGETLYRYMSTNNAYRYCIPYNDDTKHLVGTSEEAPEYYRYWEE